MGYRNKWLQMVIFTAVVLIGGFTILSGLFQHNQITKTGDKAPDFSLLGVDGKVHHLSDYKGKPLIINFWGSFCKPCVQETPALEKQYLNWKPTKDFEIVGIDLSEDVITVKGFTEQYGVSYPILLDKKNQVEKQYSVAGYPTTFFVDAKGTIRQIYEGGMPEDVIQQGLLNLFGQ